MKVRVRLDFQKLKLFSKVAWLNTMLVLIVCESYMQKCKFWVKILKHQIDKQESISLEV